MQICVCRLIVIGSDNGLVPSHYPNQCWDITNWTLRNKIQWNWNWNSNIFIHRKAFENVWKMAAILSWPQYVNSCPWGCGSKFKMQFSNPFYRLRSPTLQSESHRTPKMISQHRFRWWVDAIRQQSFTWANVDSHLCHHMASLGLLTCTVSKLIIHMKHEGPAQYKYAVLPIKGFAL